MTDLVAMLSTGKGTWAEVANLIKAQEWENVYLIANTFGAQNFSADRAVNFVIIDNNADTDSIQKAILEQLKGKIRSEIALSMYSGSGKEHMALISAALQFGVGIRLVVMKNKEMIEL